MKECLVALSFYVGAAIVFGIGVWYSRRRPVRRRVLRRLADRVLPVGRQPVHLHHHHGQVRGPARVPADGADDRHRARAGDARHLHRGRCGRDQQFSWVFYLFGAFLVLTAVNLAREGHEEEQGYDEPRLVRWVRQHLPVSEEWNGVKFFLQENGKRLLTPMAMVVITLGMTDLLFALDSIPAIYGLTQEPYLVLTANVFALMGLRQLYFLIGGLLQRLVYLSYGLAFLLLFIGVKLILHAMHENELPFINGGEHVGWAPEIPIWLSLLVILGTLVVTAVTSLTSDRSKPEPRPERYAHRDRPLSRESPAISARDWCRGCSTTATACGC